MARVRTRSRRDCVSKGEEISILKFYSFRYRKGGGLLTQREKSDMFLGIEVTIIISHHGG